jgi:hypothetical protein
MFAADSCQWLNPNVKVFRASVADQHRKKRRQHQQQVTAAGNPGLFFFCSGVLTTRYSLSRAMHHPTVLPCSPKAKKGLRERARYKT